MKYGNEKQVKEKYKKLRRLLEKMKEGVVLVEGKRDRSAFEKLGVKQVITIS